MTPDYVHDKVLKDSEALDNVLDSEERFDSIRIRYEL